MTRNGMTDQRLSVAVVQPNLTERPSDSLMSATGGNIPRCNDGANRCGGGIFRTGPDIQVTTQAQRPARGERPMKEMWSAAIVIVAASAAVGAQSGKEMDKSMMGDKTPIMYTGCVESVNHGGT